MGLLGDVVGAVAKLGPLAYKTVAKIKDRYEPIVRPDPSDPLLCWLVGSINSYRLVKDLIWFTLLCVPLSCILACLHYYHVFGLGSNAIPMTWQLVGLAIFLLQAPVYVAVVVITVLSLGLYACRLIPRRNFAIYILAAVLLLVAHSALRSERPLLEKITLIYARDRAYELFGQGRQLEAKPLFERLLHVEVPGVSKSELKGFLAGVLFAEEEYADSMDLYCSLLLETPHLGETHRANIITSLHQSIYRLAHSIEFESAEEELLETQRNYGARCISESSPFWLAISPELWYYMTEGPGELDICSLGSFEDFLRFQTDQLGADSPGAHGTEMLARMELDRGRLRYLLRQYPDEKYAEHTLYLLGEYDTILEDYQDGTLRHLALYAKGCEAFGHRDFQGAIGAFERFLLEYPSHDWADTAYQRISQSYLQLGDERSALHIY
jgi:tetratricopeptide (TPR) repeat protein